MNIDFYQLFFLFDCLFGELLFCIYFLSQILVLVFSKLAVHFLHHLLLLGQSKIHRYILLTGLVFHRPGACCGEPGLQTNSSRPLSPQPGEMFSRITADRPGSWCGLRCKRRSPCRSCSPGCRRGPSCGSAGRHGTCCRRSRCTARP